MNYEDKDNNFGSGCWKILLLIPLVLVIAFTECGEEKQEPAKQDTIVIKDDFLLPSGGIDALRQQGIHVRPDTLIEDFPK